MSATGAVIARILTQYSDKGSKAAQKDIARLTKKFDDFGKRAKKSFGIAIAATATLAIKISKDAVEAAIEDSKSQAQLALAMQNTTGATKEAIAAAEDYIEKTMLRVNVADELLRSSLSTLYVATGDLTEAQRLQGIALDVAASQGKDLATVTVAMTKAQQGNVSALKKLSPELSGLISTGMAAEEAFALLEMTYAGSAEALADLDPLTGLKLAYGEVLETLGYELLPVVKEFVTYVKEDLLPIIDEWIKANGDNLRDALKGFLKVFLALGETVIDIGQILNRFDKLIRIALLFVGVGKAMKLFGGIAKKTVGLTEDVRKKLKGLGDTFKKFSGSDSGLYKSVELIGSFVSKLGKFLLSLPIFAAAVSLAKNSFNALFGDTEGYGDALDKTTKKIYGGAAAEKYKAEVAAAAAKKLAAARAKAAAEAAKQAAEEKKAAALQAAIDAKVLSIRKQLNITKDSAIDKETDLIQLGAAEFFLKKQGIVAKEELAKLERLKEENFLLAARETLAARYQDIQKAIADQVLDTKEIEDLSKKWGISNESVEAYIHLVQSINDGTISNAEVEKLAMMWGSTNEQAKAFLETYLRIHDGILTDQEVFDLLQQGWAKTEDEVRIYADLVAVVHDGIAKDEDFERLANKWKISKEKVNEYVASMGAKFDYQGVFLDPVIALAAKWDAATAALKRYLELLKTGQGFTFGTTPTIPSSPADDAAAKAAADAAAKAAADAAKVLAESEDALLSVDKTAAEIARLTAMRTEVGFGSALGFKLKEQIDALKDGDSLFTKISQVDELDKIRAMREAAAGTITAASNFNPGSFRMAEEKSMAEFASAVASRDYDERFRFQSSTMSNASGINGGNLMAAPVVNITVQGSVTAEQDLVQTVRNGLLAAQYNGNQITLQAV
jgi:hypothetical protein